MRRMSREGERERTHCARLKEVNGLCFSLRDIHDDDVLSVYVLKARKRRSEFIRLERHEMQTLGIFL